MDAYIYIHIYNYIYISNIIQLYPCIHEIKYYTYLDISRYIHPVYIHDPCVSHLLYNMIILYNHGSFPHILGFPRHPISELATSWPSGRGGARVAQLGASDPVHDAINHPFTTYKKYKNGDDWGMLDGIPRMKCGIPGIPQSCLCFMIHDLSAQL